MYKIYQIMYNDGDWYTNGPPTLYHIAKSEQEVIDNSKFYKLCLDKKERRGGDTWIGPIDPVEILLRDIENLDDYNITITIEKKEV